MTVSITAINADPTPRITDSVLPTLDRGPVISVDMMTSSCRAVLLAAPNLVQLLCISFACSAFVISSRA